MSQVNQEMIPLAEGSRRLKQGWRVTWNMVLRGELPAERRNGRWWVDAHSVDRLAHQRAGSGVDRNAHGA